MLAIRTWKHHGETIEQLPNGTFFTPLTPDGLFGRVNWVQTVDGKMAVIRKYEGQIQDKIPHGYGVCEHRDGTREEGEWIQGVFQRVVAPLASIQKYKTGQGDAKFSPPIQGVLNWENGDRYHGMFRPTGCEKEKLVGIPHGYGEFTAKGKKSFGEWEEGVRVLPVNTEELPNGRWKITYSNGKVDEGVMEKVSGSLQLVSGKRTHRSGLIESGTFKPNTGELVKGEKIHPGGKIDLLDWEFICINGVDHLIEYEGKLLVLRKTGDKYVLSEKTPLALISESALSGNKAVIEYKHCHFPKEVFIEWASGNDLSGVPRIFSLADDAAHYLLCHRPDLSKSIHPKTGKTLFLHAAEHQLKLVLFILEQRCHEEFKKQIDAIMTALMEGGAPIELVDIGRRLVSDPFLRIMTDIYMQYTVPRNKRQELTPGQVERLYNAAYEFNNPYLYKELDTPIVGSQFQLNFYCETLDPTVTTQLKYWADYSEKETQINIWIDERKVSREEIDKFLSDLKPGKKIEFRPVQSLGAVDLMDKERVRALIGYQVLKEKKCKYAIVADPRCQPHIPPHMFDQKTVELLDERGFVVARDHSSPNHLFNLYFQILNSENEALVKSYEEILIQQGVKDKGSPLTQYYQIMAARLLEAKGTYGPLRLSSEEKAKAGDHWKDDHFPFGEKVLLKAVMPLKPLLGHSQFTKFKNA